MEGWKIQRDRQVCAKPGCPLPAATEFFAVLELPDCTRKDMCSACFHQLAAGDAARPIYWKARRAEGGKRGPSLDLVSLRVLFDRLGEVDSEQARGLRYFVALLLIRKRLLKIADPQSEAEERADFVVFDPKAADPVRVLLFAPELDAERMSHLKDELLAAIEETGADGAVDADEAGVD